MNALDYPVVGEIKISETVTLPLIDIPMMSDEQWQQLARENAVHNYIREHGHEPESEAAACLWQRERMATREREG